MYSLIWWSLMWRPGKSSIPLVAETNQQLGRAPPDRQTGSKNAPPAGTALRSGYALPSIRPRRSFLILIVAGFSPRLSPRTTQWRLGDVKLLGGPTEAAFSGNSHEVPQVSEFHHHTSRV
jgi:hypothetical protein